MADILVVDDDQSIANAFKHFLTYEGHACRIASNARDAARLIKERRPTLVMMDIRMPGVDGLQALEQFRAQYPGICVVIMTAYGTSQTSIDAIRGGAFDYLTKPLDLDELRAVIVKALASQETSEAAAPIDDAAAPVAISLVGETPAMLDVYKMIGRLAPNRVPALVVGERGAGKHLVASTIHGNSERRDRLLVVVDGATATVEDLEAKLFNPDVGSIEIAGVADLAPAVQASLVRALAADRGRDAGTATSARIIATAERDPADDVRRGTFSRELYDELAVIIVRVPPLRERREDIALLIRYFIKRFNAELNRTIRGVEESVMRRLQDHDWPGNVGELERVVKRACIVARSEVIAVDDIGESLNESRLSWRSDAVSALADAARTALHDRLVHADSSESVYHDLIDEVETTLVTEALTITNNNQVKAANILGVNRATLRKKMPNPPSDSDK